MAGAHPWHPGYSVVAVATLAFIATAPGQTFIVSQFNAPFRESFGIGELTLNVAYTVATVAASLPLVYVGALTDRLGPRRTLALAGMAFGLACAAMGAVNGAAGVFLGFFLLRFLGQGALAMISQHAIAMWFHRRLGAMQGIKQVAIFAVWVPFPLLAATLIEHAGWRLAFVVMGALVVLSVVPASLLFVRDKPEDIGLKIDHVVGPTNHDRAAHASIEEESYTLREATRTRTFWLIAAATFVSPLVGTAFLFDIQPILAQRGLSSGDATFAVSAWTVSMALMAIPSGMLTDRVRASALMPLGMVAIGLSAAMLWGAQSKWLAAFALGVFGLGQSVIASTGHATIARRFGRANHGAIRASIVRLGVIGAGVGPTFSALSAHLTGGYGAAFTVFMGMSVLVGVGCLSIPKPSRGGPV